MQFLNYFELNDDGKGKEYYNNGELRYEGNISMEEEEGIQ